MFSIARVMPWRLRLLSRGSLGGPVVLDVTDGSLVPHCVWVRWHQIGTVELALFEALGSELVRVESHIRERLRVLGIGLLCLTLQVHEAATGVLLREPVVLLAIVVSLLGVSRGLFSVAEMVRLCVAIRGVDFFVDALGPPAVSLVSVQLLTVHY